MYAQVLLMTVYYLRCACGAELASMRAEGRECWRCGQLVVDVEVEKTVNGVVSEAVAVHPDEVELRSGEEPEDECEPQ